MKIIEEVASDKYYDNNCGSFLRIIINGKTVFDVADGEPEDNNLSRNFNDCLSIINMLKDAWLAGSAGEIFDVEIVKKDE